MKRRRIVASRKREDLDAVADAFVRSGLTLDEFDELAAADRNAIVRAAERVWAERAVKLARALTSPKGQAELAAPFDGGLALRTLAALEQLERTPVAEGG